jgi:hypothetical protein
LSEGGIAEDFADGKILKIYAKGQFLEEAVLAGYGLELTAEVAAVKDRRIDAEDVMEKATFESGRIQEMAGGRRVLPGCGIGANVEKEF